MLHEDTIKLGDGSFIYNSTIINLTIPSQISTLGSKVFTDCDKLTSVIIPNTVKSMGDQCFYGCGSLKTATVQSNVLGKSCFATCFDLETVDFSNSNITEFPEQLFYWCLDLKTIVIPETVKHIGSSCFVSCTKLGDITSLPITAPTLGTTVFGMVGNSGPLYTGNNVDDPVLTVPSNATGYESEDWFDVLQEIVGFTLVKF